ncbi:MULTISPECIES: hydroxyacylglutathione hydrolase [unclassified Brenneria]|uniref:hydroxyacylglutathione hydrolase n=1 Tax=unclassified Brenneria TaxID=2634434 RepID=UPI001554FAC4|nr:hydroxyacylglutathione hydrolase [Brenneria sp. hezel4-2-4]MEE3652993.1 hydroxyacylglutathione hydrolase [Brenneria sp. HEZEL_4_2_4]NPD02946.1 hydroxyacylglutathione hydrolase [Brenneria sp. hezel4-2-4]
MNLISIAALQDNYIWLLSNKEKQCVIVDPGEAQPVLDALAKHQLAPEAILLTHHHHDHVGGVAALVERYANLPVFGPPETQKSGATIIVEEGETLSLLNSDFSVLAVPGHTAGHIAYYSHPYLFCGDTLFSGGCGRIFEGTPKQMYDSIEKISKLPDDTLICCAHEYTLSNLEFAHAIWPEEPTISSYLHKIRQIREKSQSSLPTTLGMERKINLFLRCYDFDLKRKISSEPENIENWQAFSKLRSKKDCF